MNDIRPFKGSVPKISSSCYIDRSAVIIGDVVIDEDSSVWCNVVIRGDVNSISIGKRSNVQDGSVLHVTHKSETQNGHKLIIEDDVTIGHNVVLHGCTLKSNSFIGMNSLLMDGVIVENNVFVAANSLVIENTVLESNYLYMGQPAKKKRLLSEEELTFIKKSANNYVAFAKDMKQENY